MSSRDADRLFHETWLGLAQPIEGLVFSVPVLAEAQIAPAARPEITSQIRARCEELAGENLVVRSVRGFFESFLGYDSPGSLIEREALPVFYAPESGQEIRATFAIARTPQAPENDPFAEFSKQAAWAANDNSGNPILALVWDLTDASAAGALIDLDKPETVTGSWNYPPTAKFERLLRHAGIPIGFLSNRRELRLIYAPAGETTSHLTFRIDDLADPAGRPIALAMELIFHARRTYGSDAKYTFEGLLAESRRRQADVTGQLAEQVFDAVETLLAGFEAAAARDCRGDRVDWMSAALNSEQVHEGMLNAVLRLVFILYAEDRSLLPVDHRLYAEHFSLLALYERLVHDAGAHPESMHHRFGAYGALTTLFRAIYFGVRHGTLHLPPRQGKLFDPSAYPFLEGGLPDWTAAVNRAEDRAQVSLPSVDDKTIHDVLHGLIVLDGQRLSYRDLSVEQIGAVYESLMGYRVEKVAGPAVRLGKNGVWIELKGLRGTSKQEQRKLLEDRCDVSAASSKNIALALNEHRDDDAAADAIAALTGRKSQIRNRARTCQLVMQPTSSRRDTGSHYTPRSLSERIVRRTLEPVLACLGPVPTADLILQLKVCDPAMGSGAFLVEACRFLGERVVEAWRQSGDLPTMLERHGEPLLHAKRLVAEQCLYGIDKNAAAVELAKLSLWLETLSSDKPFTFVDHVLRCGDSLVGLGLDQIRSFHWSPEKQLPTVAQLIDAVLVEVREHREAIRALADDDRDESQREKRRLFELAELAMSRARLIADACVGAFFSTDVFNAKEQERLRRLAVVESWLTGNDEHRPTVEGWAATIRSLHAPFHWQLELPEVFVLTRRDPLESGRANGAAFVDAFLGNPPFAGHETTSRSLGTNYVFWLRAAFPRSTGNTDLCAYFFRRAGELIGQNGVIGLIATSTIVEGDTRRASLDALIEDGCSIFEAKRKTPWPGTAAVWISEVHMGRGTPLKVVGRPILDGQSVGRINARLEIGAEESNPESLSSNIGLASKGLEPRGAGFFLSSQERADLIQRSARNEERIFKFIGADDFLKRPTTDSDRWVINFGAVTLEAAATWPDLLDIVAARVRPERSQMPNHAPGMKMKKYWWQFYSEASVARTASIGLETVLVVPELSKHHVITFGPASYIYGNTCCVIALDTMTAFAILQSSIHAAWSRKNSSSRGEGGRYVLSRSFETFPFPIANLRSSMEALEVVGAELYRQRAVYMLEANQGLTQTYTELRDRKCEKPTILRLRELHEKVDRAVLDAYGWADLRAACYCPSGEEELAEVERMRRAVVERLFLLNSQRAEEENREGAAASTKTRKRAAKKKAASAVQSQLTFDSTAGDES
jgi:hypothetical protein